MNLDVSGLDLCQGANVEHRGLSGERLQLEGAELGPLEAELGCVAEHEARDEQQEAVDGLHGQPLHEPHGQTEGGAAEHLPWQDVHLTKVKQQERSK